MQATLLLVVSALAIDPPAHDPSHESLDLDPDFATPWYRDDDGETDHEHLIEAKVFPGLIDYGDVDWTIEAYGLQSSHGDFTTDARLHATGTVRHPFEGEVQGLSIATGLFLPSEARDAYERLTKPPLQLTQDDIDRPKPEPEVALTNGRITVASMPGGSGAELSVDEDLGEITLSWAKMPTALVVTEGYELVEPTPTDILTIIAEGGAADQAALARWADEHRDIDTGFDEANKREIMATVRKRFRDLRAPPSLGDFHRLSALVALIRTFGGSEDIEPLLELERPIKILHTSALLSYDLAIRDEAYLGLPVHGMRELPARSKFLDAPDAAMKSLRAPALDRLLWLAFDPLDFRDAPASIAAKHSRLARQAASLLEPLNTTDVAGVLKACRDNDDVQAEVLRFYIQVRHAPVVEHLVEWLTTHPEAVDDIGMLAVHELPEALLPALMHHYIDPKDPEFRPIVRRLLEALPPALSPKLLQMLRSVGLNVAHLPGEPHEQVIPALDHFESVERELAKERAVTLEAQVLEAGTDVASLRSTIRAAARLGQLDPDAIERNAPLIIDVLEKAAWEFEVDSPAERTKALGLLDQLPWGKHTADAKRAIALTEARLMARRGESQGALDHLLGHDPKLEHEEIRQTFTAMLRDQFFSQMNGGAFNDAAKSLDLAEHTIDDRIDIPRLRGELMWAQYKPAFILGGAFALALMSTLTWLVARSLSGAVARAREAAKARRLLRRRRADADANAEDTAAFAGDDEFVEAPTALDGPLAAQAKGEAEVSQPDPPEAEPKSNPTEEASPDAATRIESGPPLDPSAEPSLASNSSASGQQDPMESDDPLHEDTALEEFDDPLGDPFSDSFSDASFEDDFGWGDSLGPS